MTETPKNREKLKISSIFPFLGFIVVVVFFAIMIPIVTQGKASLFSSRTLKTILNDGLYLLLMSTAYAFVMAEGQIDFSTGANVAVSCAVAAVAAKTISPLAAIPAALLTGGFIGLINSLIIVKLNVNAFITTLSMQYICNGLTLVVLKGAILMAPLEMMSWYTDGLKIVLATTFLVVGYFTFEKTRYGKACKAVGSSPEAVRQSGINVSVTRMTPYIIMGTVAGLVGFLSLIRTTTASAQTGSSLMINVLNACLIGGVPFTGGTNAKFRSVLLGVLTMTILTCGMTLIQVDTIMQQVVKGVIFLVAVSVSYDRSNVKVIK